MNIFFLFDSTRRDVFVEREKRESETRGKKSHVIIFNPNLPVGREGREEKETEILLLRLLYFFYPGCVWASLVHIPRAPLAKTRTLNTFERVCVRFLKEHGSRDPR